MAFDPYLIWLDISPHERPVNYYRLFGLRPLEADAGLIAAAAQRVIGHVSQFQNSANAAVCQQLLGELHAARACLLDPSRKAAYDRGFSSPGGAERTMMGPPMPGAQAAQRPAAATSATPAWLANVQAKRAPRTEQRPAGQGPAERQIVSSPPPPTGLAASARSATPYVPAQPLQPPATPTPTSKPAGFDAPLKPLHPSGAIPFGSAATPQNSPTTSTSPQGYRPAPSAAASYSPPYVPASQPPSATTYTPPTAPAYAPPQQPPAWAAAERTGQVSTVVAGDQTQTATITEPPRRVVRRQQNSTLTYVVVALAMAMIVFFFGAVLLLALFLAAR